MATKRVQIKYTRQFDAQAGQLVPIAPGIARLTAPNANAYTFTGTNSFVIGERELAIVDPGPDDNAHLDALLSAIDGRPVAAIILTHTHRDHAGLTSKLADAVKAPLWFEGAHRLSRPLREGEEHPLPNAGTWDLKPDRYLRDGEHIEVDGIKLEILATPGHCANHIALGMVDRPYLLTGDHIMGWSSTLVAPVEGSMQDYFKGLERVIDAPWDSYLPAHGGPIPNGREHAHALRAHRQKRNAEIISALSSQPSGLDALTKIVYPRVNASIAGAARMTLAAHLEYLEIHGEVSRDSSGSTEIFMRTQS